MALHGFCVGMKLESAVMDCGRFYGTERLSGRVPCFPTVRALGLAAAAALGVGLLAGCGGESLPAGCVASRENDKYCLDHDDSVLLEDSEGGTLEVFRVVALRDIAVKFPGRSVVKVADWGDRGGYIEGEWNLSLNGPAWQSCWLTAARPL